MLVRGGMLYFKSIDYNNFLNPWIGQMQDLSFRKAISAKIGDYNMPYLYVLALISRVNISSLYLIKMVSIAFDVILAYYVMKIVSLKFNNINVEIAAFVAILGVPTVILNGAFWAQCDVIYSTLAIASLYYGCTGKNVKCLVFYGLAFSVRLQAIFMAPVLIVFLFTKKIKATSLWIPVLTFYVTLIPALIAGKPFVRTFSIYFEQMKSYPEMSLNIPNIYVLLGSVKFENFNFAAIFLTGVAVASLLYFLYLNREKITLPVDYVSIALAFALLMPLLLPRMHERYFFLADVLSVVFVFFNRKRWYFAPIIILGSFMTYSKFLIGRNYIVPMEYASIAMIFITIIVVKDLAESIFRKEQ
jgi:Gpi18-like mannosyltransferase